MLDVHHKGRAVVSAGTAGIMERDVRGPARLRPVGHGESRQVSDPRPRPGQGRRGDGGRLPHAEEGQGGRSLRAVAGRHHPGSGQPGGRAGRRARRTRAARPAPPGRAGRGNPLDGPVRPARRGPRHAARGSRCWPGCCRTRTPRTPRRPGSSAGSPSRTCAPGKVGGGPYRAGHAAAPRAAGWSCPGRTPRPGSVRSTTCGWPSGCGCPSPRTTTSGLGGPGSGRPPVGLSVGLRLAHLPPGDPGPRPVVSRARPRPAGHRVLRLRSEPC